jgi:hypothetical protein
MGRDRMETVNRIHMDAAPDIIFRLAADVERWPILLAHYRYVFSLGDDGGSDGRIVAMGATRRRIPVHWTARQTLHADAGEIRYTHIGGVTLGMEVVWRLQPTTLGTEVTIDHRMRSNRLWLRNRPAEHIVGDWFVATIADMTLRGIKEIAEGRVGMAR